AKNYTDTCIYYCAPDTHSFVQRSISQLNFLEVNHPNPFSHLTTISYFLAEYGLTKLCLYDELGREVSRIIDRVQDAGKYSFDFDGSKLPAGNYILRLESGGEVVSKKISKK